MSAISRYRPSRESWPFELGLMVLVGLFFTATGLFQSDQAPWPVRGIYWCSVMVVGGLIEMAAEIGWEKFAPATWRRAWRSFLPVSVLATTPQVGVVIFFEASLFQARGDLSDLAGTWVGVFTVMTAMVALLRLSRIQLDLHRAPPPDLAPVMPSLIADKLPANLSGAELVALQAEDHYVRVFTSRGSQLILLRFGDALTAVADLPGFQLHRSWWAAQGALESARYSRGTGEASLRGGLKAPISRTYAAALREAGVLTA
jgi:hypothetical protein